MNHCIASSPTPPLAAAAVVDLLDLIAETDDRDPVLSPDRREVDENEIELETYRNPEVKGESPGAFEWKHSAGTGSGAVGTSTTTGSTSTVEPVSTAAQGVEGGGTELSIAPLLMNPSGTKTTATRSALTPRTDTNHPAADKAVPPVATSKPTGRKSMRTAAPPRPAKSDPSSKSQLRPSLDERPPRNSAASPNRISSNVSTKSARSVASGDPLPQTAEDFQWTTKSNLEKQEQALFEQRLCEDAYGVAIRKINQSGKSNLRYVKCIVLDDGEESVGNRSVGSMVRASFSRRARSDKSVTSNEDGKQRKFLVWGKKKDCRVPLARFTGVKKGKTTERTRRNAHPASRLLSLTTNDANHPSLDIEAPTRIDRDKFASAFATFLGIPLDSDSEGFGSAATADGGPKSPPNITKHSAAHSSPDMDALSKRALSHKTGTTVLGSAASSAVAENMEIEFEEQTPSTGKQSSAEIESNKKSRNQIQRSQTNIISIPVKSDVISPNSQKVIISGFNPDEMGAEDGTVVSSLTGIGFDQEIVEELHLALTELRAELEASRAEASRAVKVAEQAIQSAENSSSKDWNSTVTHKAAEAAALAQKKSAEAMAKARLAEERLAGERRTASFWRRQAEAAEEDAGALQTRAAAAEVQRASMAEELECERRKAATLMGQLKQRLAFSEIHQREAIESAMERNRSLEIELDGTRRDLLSRNEEAKSLQDELSEVTMDGSRSNGRNLKKGLTFGGKKKRMLDSKVTFSSQSLLPSDVQSSSSDCVELEINESGSSVLETLPAEEVQKLSAEFSAVKLQFELLKRTTTDELISLPEASKVWAAQVAQALEASESEVSRLRAKLALESSTRRKLLHEVQDLRGAVRVYCRPRPLVPQDGATPKFESILSTPSREMLLFHREKLQGTQDLPPMAFEFDRIFDPQMDQTDVYGELEELVLNVLDGYNICLMAFGQTGSGKTHSMIGDISYTISDFCAPTVEIENYGIHLLGAKQLFDVAEHRSERYQDVFFMTLVEVNDERLCDLIAGTEIGGSLGRIQLDNAGNRNRRESRGSKHFRGNSDEIGTSTHDSSKPNKLEIRTSNDGDTVVQGLVSMPVSTFEEVLNVWKEALSLRADRLQELGMDIGEYEAASHVIATFKVVSTNIATGIGTVGKIQFVDLAGADLDLTPRRPPSGTKSKSTVSTEGPLVGIDNKNELKYVQKSLSTFSEVINARSQFTRTVPYRNSTLTHLLRDSLEADTKVMMLVTVSSDPRHAQETACALRLATRVRRINVGKATKHSLSQI